MTLDKKDIWRLNHILDAIANVEECVTKKMLMIKFYRLLWRSLFKILVKCVGVQARDYSIYILIFHGAI